VLSPNTNYVTPVEEMINIRHLCRTLLFSMKPIEALLNARLLPIFIVAVFSVHILNFLMTRHLFIWRNVVASDIAN
jgi:hypothetical protein